MVRWEDNRNDDDGVDDANDDDDDYDDIEDVGQIPLAGSRVLQWSRRRWWLWGMRVSLIIIIIIVVIILVNIIFIVMRVYLIQVIVNICPISSSTLPWSSDINLSVNISPTGAVEVVVVVGDADHAGVAADVAAVGGEPFQGWFFNCNIWGCNSQETNLQSPKRDLKWTVGETYNCEVSYFRQSLDAGRVV